VDGGGIWKMIPGGPLMPLVTISLLRGRSEVEKRQVSDHVHRALVEAFKIPEDDFNHRRAEYDTKDWTLPGNRSDKFVLIEMTVFPGRSREAKRRLYQGIVTRLESRGIPGNDVLIVLNEPPLENWGIHGGRLADETEIGFNVNV
jgi:phenylpyruvate tautomerase PptA (4-oxalocrotonate tautomerase family)